VTLPGRKYLFLSGVSGVLWGCVVTVIAFDAAPRAIWGGLIASPLIGCMIGAATKRWSYLSLPLRVVVALVSVYVAAALFGLGVGLYDWLAVDIPNRIAYGVVVQAVLAFLWGLTFIGWCLVFWPLAYLNHWLLGRVVPAGQLTSA
jgi:hypothetical protein